MYSWYEHSILIIYSPVWLQLPLDHNSSIYKFLYSTTCLPLVQNLGRRFFVMVVQLAVNCQWWIRIGICNEQLAQEVLTTYTMSVATVNNNNCWMIPIWYAFKFKSSPHFPKWPMSNWFHPLMVMIKVRPNWYVDYKSRDNCQIVSNWQTHWELIHNTTYHW